MTNAASNHGLTEIAQGEDGLNERGNSYDEQTAAWGWRLLFGLLRVLPQRRLTGTAKAPDRIPYA